MIINRHILNISGCSPRSRPVNAEFVCSRSLHIRIHYDSELPSNWHSIHKNDLARAMVAQTEQAFLAIAQGNAPKEPTVMILEYKDMEPFFVKVESDEP
jgi:hypothetical protein